MLIRKYSFSDQEEGAPFFPGMYILLIINGGERYTPHMKIQ